MQEDALREDIVYWGIQGGLLDELKAEGANIWKYDRSNGCLHSRFKIGLDEKTEDKGHLIFFDNMSIKYTT